MSGPVPERILARLIVQDGCWGWRGARHPDGYAQAWYDGQARHVHVLLYEAWIGPIPEGLQLDHLCRNPRCPNPWHTEPVTSAENTRRGDAGKHNLPRTHCPQGHAYAGDNVVVRCGYRVCRECERTRAREYQRRRHATQAQTD